MTRKKGDHTSVAELMEHAEKRTIVKTNKPPLLPKPTEHGDNSSANPALEGASNEPEEDMEEEDDNNVPDYNIPGMILKPKSPRKRKTFDASPTAKQHKTKVGKIGGNTP